MSGDAQAAGWARAAPDLAPYGDCGGDSQATESWGARFVHTQLPGRVADITFYGVVDDAGQITLERQVEMTVCDDVDDPGSTEVWAEATYTDLGVRCGDEIDAEFAALTEALEASAEDVEWDGWWPGEGDGGDSDDL